MIFKYSEVEPMYGDHEVKIDSLQELLDFIKRLQKDEHNLLQNGAILKIDENKDWHLIIYNDYIE